MFKGDGPGSATGKALWRAVAIAAGSIVTLAGRTLSTFYVSRPQRRRFAVLTCILLHFVVPPVAEAQTNYQRLRSLDGGTGIQPYAGLVEGRDGRLYGATFAGGATNRGTIFSLHKSGAEFRILHIFSNSGGGATRPGAHLIHGTDGALYGTTASGGTENRGTVFTLRTDGTGYSVLHSFTGANGDGSQPQGALIEGSDGALYGTTYVGGIASAGTVYKLQKNGTGYAVLRRFQGDADGQFPIGALVEGTNGMLYGTTYSGISGSAIFGTIFQLNKDGTGYAVLHRFNSVAWDGTYPYGNLLQGRDGRLYGTASGGGAGGNNGAVFRIDLTGANYTVLRSFAGPSSDGSLPRGMLAESPDGALYGITANGGSGTNGIVYKLQKDGSGYAILHRFTSDSGGGNTPAGGVTWGSDNALYGTTLFGGHSGGGTVFRLSSTPGPVRASAMARNGNSALITFSSGVAGRTYTVEATTSLNPGAAWLPIGSAVAQQSGEIDFVDFAAGSFPIRFYRAGIQ